MKKIRVLVAEDSLTIRTQLVNVLRNDPEIEVVAEAADGQQAIDLCTRLLPDVVTLDMIMPVMTGLTATEHIMAYCPTPILVVSSSINRGELFKTYDALAAGAVDVLEKPRGDSFDKDWERHFLARLKLVSRIKVITHPRQRLKDLGQRSITPVQPVRQSSPPRTSRYQLVAIGASTGGPGAVREILSQLPATYSLPILLVVHIGEPFGKAFAEWLNSTCQLQVRYAQHGESLSELQSLSGQVLVAPPGCHTTVRNGHISLTTSVERHYCRPSVDELFESVATEIGDAAVGCLLTGMGRDGAAGLLAMRRAGALTLVQNESTSIVYGMPREAINLGAALDVLPLQAIAPKLIHLARNKPSQP